ncbi:MAG: hypothetical protein ACF8LK_06180 [Phycisphaerales bacterium JB041]
MSRMHGGSTATRTARTRTLRRVMVGLCLSACAGALTGCVDPLLSPNEPRSQYSRYDLVRGRFAPQYVEDEFGRRKPNLRGRLLLPE